MAVDAGVTARKNITTERLYSCMRTSVSIILAVLMTVGLAAAAVPATAQTADQDAETVAETYNDNIDQVPDVIKNRFADERVEISVEASDGTAQTYTAVTDEQARIQELKEGSDDPTIHVSTDEETINEVANADDPKAAGLEAYNSDEVTVEGVGFTNKVKVGAAKVSYRVGSALGIL
ncbi:MAG: hypothetical protein ACI8UR_000552 [Natronomonas sp.]